MENILVGVGGGTGSGKTTLCKKVKEEMGDLMCLISLDRYFYKETDSHNRPESINIDKFLKDLEKLKQGKKVVHRGRTFKKKPIIVVEGRLVLTFDELFKQLDLSIFLDMDIEERVIRRLERNMEGENNNFKKVTDWYRSDVRENHWKFIEPTKEKADLIMWGKINQRRVEVLSNILQGFLK